jgi:clan AA aspartic protease (TIGR02281 family)
MACTRGSYDGDFRDGKRDGHGVYTWPSGGRYQGEWRDNKRNGHGIFVTPTGDRYEGEWSGDKFSRPLYEISLQQEKGVFWVPVIINGTIKLDFTIDSGAADVNIPADVAFTLFRTKTLTEEDFLGRQTYMLADGSSVPSDSFRIQSLRIGDFELKNVTASVGSVSGVPLLGQSFLRRLGRWSIDNQRNVLVLDGEATAENNNEQ